MIEPEGGLRVVYIEDNVSNLELLERVFQSIDGLELIPAMQASVGLQLIEDHRPDVVLLDLHLPDIQGIDVLKRLKGDPKTADTPVIVLSADATEAQIKRLLEAGAKAYLTKPLDLQLLISELNSIKPKK
jgi:CheY-like chemotaxis protein